jgi:hypothetical protein
LAKAAEIACLQRRSGHDERAAECPFMGGLAVALVGHVLGACGAHVVLDILVEDGQRARAEMGHHVFADETVGIG